MRRAVLLLAAALCALILASPAVPESRITTVYLVNASTTVTDAELANALPAFQNAVSDDFAPLWGADATLSLADPPPGAVTLTLQDALDCLFCGGYHSERKDGTAYALVLADKEWQLVVMHELEELLADPHLDRVAWDGGQGLRLVEVSDPVEDARYAYQRPGADGTPVTISDFVTPAWYRRHSRGPYDFARHVKRPLQLLSGGYANVWRNGAWQEVDG